ncbi:MAG: polymer-forming cytoskeletal protein [Sphingobium sp.]
MFSKPVKSPIRPGAPATGARQIPFSLIGGDIAVRGDIEATADLHVDGRVDGDIACAALVLGPDSRVTGNIRAKSARIAGLVEGSIAAGDVVVEASARITGDITYDTISIAPGAQVAGHFARADAAEVAGADLKLVAREGTAV